MEDDPYWWTTAVKKEGGREREGKRKRNREKEERERGERHLLQYSMESDFRYSQTNQLKNRVDLHGQILKL